ncbi:MAG: chromate resistance protein ChrB domain-containing protein [Dongiaceae bacterium]
MKWITRERPKIDRVACPWLVSRFIDRGAEFLFVPADRVLAEAARLNAVPYDVPDVELSHVGPLCSFDAFLAKFELDDPALTALAPIIRGADTGHPELAPEAPGLLALSLGLSRRFDDDHEMLRHGMVMYDALYAWAAEARHETHGWSPQPGSQTPGSQTPGSQIPASATIDPAALRSLLARDETLLLLDVRKRPAYNLAGRRIAGAVWRDPFAVETWADRLPRDRVVVVYCVHGHEVSHGVRDALIAHGIDARLIDGGYEAWIAAGGAVETNPPDAGNAG